MRFPKLPELSKKQYIVFGTILIIIIAAVFFRTRGNSNGEYIVVERRDIVEEVSVAGRVEAGTVAELGFEVTGKTLFVPVEEGDIVSVGDLLVSLKVGTLSAELQQARADVLIKEVEAINAAANLEEVIAQQDILVESAYRKLLSSDLDAFASNGSVTATAPLITGRYTGEEGRYKVRVVNRAGNIHKYDLRTFDIENTGLVNISETTVTPIGTYGLFISFPDSLSNYNDTTWYVDIPNVDTSTYTANLNAYEEALRARSLTIEQAQAGVSAQISGISIVQAKLLRARANVNLILAEIAKRRITAPFSGIVTQVDIDPGEIVTANSVVVSLISDGGFGIEIDLPEVDSVKVNTGDSARVTLDAFGGEVFFEATITSVNKTETIVDKVPVYEARLGFNQDDDRIRSGMTTNVTITTDIRRDVLGLPARAVKFREDGTTYVFTESNGDIREKNVTLGLRGSDGYFEVLSGLSEGSIVIVKQ